MVEHVEESYTQSSASESLRQLITKHTEWLLLQGEECSVKELQILEVVIDHVIELQ